jgi:hypothetical protein
MGTRPALPPGAPARTLATFGATVASFATMYGLCWWAGAQTNASIAAALFALSFGRRPQTHARYHLLLAPVVLAFVALAAFGVGRLLVTLPMAGAAVFVTAMFFSVYARNFDGTIRRLGSLVALPLVAMLVVPAAPAHAPGGPLVDVALAASAGVVALLYANLAQWLLQRSGRAIGERPTLAATAAPGRTGLTATTRMAWQMAVALIAAFAVGFLVFPAHWGWTVLTAFIVCSGARGRGDAAYKGVLRLAGALTGTIAAALCTRVSAPSGVAEAVLIFAILFAGLLLREVNYAFWAACTTLILALLGRTQQGFDLALLGTRLEAILAGAVCAVVAAWFVFPIRTEDVIRRRLADALKALDDVIAHAHVAETRTEHVAHFDHRMAELTDVAPPVRWHRRIFRRNGASEHPAQWIDLADDIRRGSNGIASGDPVSEKDRGRLRRAIGISRRAIGDHNKVDVENKISIGAALAGVRDALLQGSSGNRD